VSPKRKNYGI